LEDPDAIYFTPDNMILKAMVQQMFCCIATAINDIKLNHNFGILFIQKQLPYQRTIMFRRNRLIGYGNKNAYFLGKILRAFRLQIQDKGVANTCFVTSSIKEPGKDVHDAGAVLFIVHFQYQFKIEDGNPFAVALRTHYAQHSFISHADIYTGNGKAACLMWAMKWKM